MTDTRQTGLEAEALYLQQSPTYTSTNISNTVLPDLLGQRAAEFSLHYLSVFYAVTVNRIVAFEAQRLPFSRNRLEATYHVTTGLVFDQNQGRRAHLLNLFKRVSVELITGTFFVILFPKGRGLSDPACLSVNVFVCVCVSICSHLFLERLLHLQDPSYMPRQSQDTKFLQQS